MMINQNTDIVDSDFQEAVMQRGLEIHQKVEELLKGSPLKEQVEEMVQQYYYLGIEFGGMVERHRRSIINKMLDDLNELKLQ